MNKTNENISDPADLHRILRRLKTLEEMLLEAMMGDPCPEIRTTTMRIIPRKYEPVNLTKIQVV